MTMRWIVALLVGGCLGAFVAPASAQIVHLRPQRTTMSVHAGLGGNPSDWSALGAAAELSTPFGVFALRTASVLETIAIFPEDTPVERNYDLGVLYGWKVHWGADPEGPRPRRRAFLSYDAALSVAAGIAPTWFIRRGAFIRSRGSAFGYHDEYEQLVERIVGFPYEIRLTLGSNLGGFSVSLFGNVNDVASYRGFLIGLFIGPRN